MHDFLPYDILMTPVKPKPIEVTQTRYKQCKSSQSQTNQTLNRYLAQVILSELERRYGATPAQDGWYACYCPFGHQEDRYPGDHAYFHPEKGLLNCFGRHKQHLIHSIASQINVDVNLYGGIYTKDKSD